MDKTFNHLLIHCSDNHLLIHCGKYLFNCWLASGRPRFSLYFAPTKPYNIGPFGTKLRSSLKSHLRWLWGTCRLKCIHSPGLGTFTRAYSPHMTHSLISNCNPRSHNHKLCRTLKTYFALHILNVAL